MHGTQVPRALVRQVLTTNWWYSPLIDHSYTRKQKRNTRNFSSRGSKPWKLNLFMFIRNPIIPLSKQSISVPPLATRSPAHQRHIHHVLSQGIVGLLLPKWGRRTHDLFHSGTLRFIYQLQKSRHHPSKYLSSAYTNTMNFILGKSDVAPAVMHMRKTSLSYIGCPAIQSELTFHGFLFQPTSEYQWS